MGTVISSHHSQRIEGMVERTSGTILRGGEPMSGISELDGFDFSKGSFFPPTVVTNISVEDELWKEEIFGPVVVIKRFLVRKFAGWRSITKPSIPFSAGRGRRYSFGK